MTQDCVKDGVPIIIPKLLKIYRVPMVGLIALEHIPNGSVRFYTFIIKKYIGENDVWYYMSVILNLCLKVYI